MSDNPPPKIAAVPSPGTPSNEWATNTTSMLTSESTDSKNLPVTTTTNISTPGHEFPGSYPKELEVPSTHRERSGSEDSRKNGAAPMGASVVHAAKQYMPDPVERGIEYTGQTAAAYLPIPQGVKDTVVSYWSSGEGDGVGASAAPSTSLPSKELTGQQPSEHTSGVGSLPGNLSESAVALLPDERTQQNQLSSSAVESNEPTTGANTLPGKSGENGVTVSPKELQGEQAQAGQGLGQATSAAFAGAAGGGLALAAKSQDTREKHPPQPQVATRKKSDVPLGDTPQVYPAPTQDKATPAHSKEKDLPAKPAGEQSDVARSKDTQGVARGAVGGVDKEQKKAAGAEDSQPTTSGNRTKAEEAAGVGIGIAGVGAFEQEPIRSSQARVRAESRGEADILKSAGTHEKERDRENARIKDEEGAKKVSRETEEGKKHTETTSTSIPDRDMDYHPAKLHPPPAVGDGTGTSSESAPSQSSPTAATGPRGESSISAANGGSPKKVGFFTKVKGEAKIIAGKMSGKEGKIEEGKKVLHGEV
ncbi:hypothetical protein BV22DRAFT_803002 [Leucogyrophana mollusca]|uniref:Uncharacterized protein n=1 Tax=Leucogyrophana mollusca TaxID=85980 RepID=A0ACB8B5A3_9AGAM|nr:hypothetical protein BV22DRAFT_803002 [Leucogyrophana mollusca]